MKLCCCRLEAASKAAWRLSSVATEVSECSSLRQSAADSDYVEMTLGGTQHQQQRDDDDDDRTADWLDDVNRAAAVAGAERQTVCDALPPPILKNGGVKKEVKFCLDVSDEDGQKRPLNVYQAMPETVMFTVCYRYLRRGGVTLSSEFVCLIVNRMTQ